MRLAWADAAPLTLENSLNRFRYLQTSLAIILVLVGIKIFPVPMGIKIDTLLSLLVTLAILAGGVIFSLWKTRDETDIGAEQVPQTGQLEP